MGLDAVELVMAVEDSSRPGAEWKEHPAPIRMGATLRLGN